MLLALASAVVCGCYSESVYIAVSRSDVAVNNAVSSVVDNREEKVPQIVGGYTDYRELSDEDKALFAKAYKGDVKLIPQSVATQVVAGLKYRFVCKDQGGKEYMVTIFQNLSGETEVMSVSPLQ